MCCKQSELRARSLFVMLPDIEYSQVRSYKFLFLYIVQVVVI